MRVNTVYTYLIKSAAPSWKNPIWKVVDAQSVTFGECTASSQGYNNIFDKPNVVWTNLWESKQTK